MELSHAHKSEKGKKNVQAEAFKLVDHTKLAPGLFALHFDMPGEKANKLSPTVMMELNGILDALRTRTDIKALVFVSDKESIFIAGADIEVIKDIRDAREGARLAAEGQAVVQKFEGLPFPVVAAIHGASMGGGTELALCCKYIVVSDSAATRIGLPEVNLGVLPGFGGTVRMPARIGLQNAMDFILTGKTMNGEKAAKIGFADAVLPQQDFHKRALAFGGRVARGEKVARTLKKTLMNSALEGNALGRAVMFSQARKMIMSKSRGHYPAPLKILDVLSANFGRDKNDAIKAESKAFGELSVTEVSKRCIDLFFATEKVKKQTGVPGGGKLEAADRATHIGVLGAGVMGGGIAQLAASKSMPVRMKDIDFKGLAIGMNAANKLFSGLVKKRKITKREADLKMALISSTTDYSGFSRVDLVIEAVVEIMDVKKKVLRETEAQLGEKAVFATNTSSLSVTELAKASHRPQNVVGMHFFNPVHKMPLIEVIRGEKTGDRAVASVFELAKRLGKTPIVVKDGPGFLVNRLLMPYLNEAAYLIAEGAPIEELDKAVLQFGMPMGPATLLDEVGLDVAVKVGKILHEAFGSRANPCILNTRLVDGKLYGKKSGKGFYLYDETGKRGELNPEIYKVLGVTPASPSKDQKANWIPRLMYPIINEAALCLAEGIVAEAQDVDLGMIMGTGFPPFRGGPLRYADSVGLQAIVNKLEELAKVVGPRYSPCAPLVERARKGQTFYS
ncbi:MAG: enoyl-CoA hydratase/isomerase family protein [Deltaproteobacteria bacterium]|nr:enoyl-CoA hydratase/isomerase family protein [Deltaproteobacteria bacterium]